MPIDKSLFYHLYYYVRSVLTIKKPFQAKKKFLDEMGHTNVLLDEMGLDEMGINPPSEYRLDYKYIKGFVIVWIILQYYSIQCIDYTFILDVTYSDSVTGSDRSSTSD